MIFKTLISGEKVNLKKLELRHAEDIRKLRQDDVIKFLPNKYHETLKKTEDYVLNCNFKWKNKKTFTYVIEYFGKIAGIIMLSRLDFKNMNSELGIWLGKEFFGKQIAKEAVNLILDYAFNELNFQRISFLIHINNIRSQKFFEKIGAKREGILRKARLERNEFEDKVLYSLLKEEFNL